MSFAKISIAITIVMAALLMGGALIYAAAEDSPLQGSSGVSVIASEGTLSQTDTLSDTNEISASLRIATYISDFFSTHAFSGTDTLSVTVDTVLDMRASGMGWGEIVKALFFASATGETVQDITDLRQSGMGWGQIKKEFDLKSWNQASMGKIMSGANKEKTKGNKDSDDDDQATATSSPSTTAGPSNSKKDDDSKEGTSAQGNGGERGQGNAVEHGKGKGNTNVTGTGSNKGGGASKGNSGNAPGKNKK